MDLINKLLFGKTYGVCIFCGKKTDLSKTVYHKDHGCICLDCNSRIDIAPFLHLYEGSKNVSFVIAPLYYSGVIRKAIHNMKFSSAPAIAEVLCHYINNYLWVFEESDDPLFNYFDCLVPVPLSKNSETERGYNQAGLLADEIGRCFNIPVEYGVLKKIKETKPQSTLLPEERIANIKDAYACTGDVEGKRILLVDDVYTTGATLEAAAKELKEKGAKSIGAITITHGSRPRHSDTYYELFS